jgi:PKD repeat protein
MVNNIGNGYASTSYTFFYLSKDRAFDSSDSYLGRVDTSSISPGKSRTVYYSATLPSGSSGGYYVIARADGTKRVTESNEGNNGGLSGLITVGSGSTPASSSAAPVAQFTATPTSGTTPLTVQFTDQSTGAGPLTYVWDFDNDGEVDSTSRNPRITYKSVKTFTVKLTVTGPGGSDSEVKTNYITVSSGSTPTSAPVSQFTASPTSGTAPLTVQFTDQSTGTVSTYGWDFNNDGTIDSTTRSPSFTYSAAGTYTVSHTVTGAGGSDSEVKTSYITVSSGSTPTSAPVSQFTASTTSGTAPLIVQFTDQSTGTVSTYGWDFNNDGTIDSTTRSPSFTYPAAGTYTVSHTVTGPGGSDSEVKTNYISVTTSSVPVTPSGVYGADANPTGKPLGGGAGYQPVYTENDARVKYIVDTKEEFLSALKSARSGDVIYIPESANIDLTGVMGTSVPAGVTIAGNRGVNGSPGGRIFQNRLSSDPSSGGPSRSMLYITGDNVRITGLRLEGPDKTTSSLGERVRRGIYVNQYNNLEVDNCELWGWSWSAVHMGDSTSTKTMYIHHNNIHHCQTDGYGYGACVSGGNMLVEANIIDYTRHAVASSGLVGETYEARYNLIGSHSTNHVFDVHEYTNPATGKLIAGRSYKIHHNTVEVSNQYAVVIRAVPVEGAWVEHNKFQWRVSYNEKWSPVCQANGVGKVYMTDNLISGALYSNGPIRLL